MLEGLLDPTVHPVRGPGRQAQPRPLRAESPVFLRDQPVDRLRAGRLRPVERARAEALHATAGDLPHSLLSGREAEHIDHAGLEKLDTFAKLIGLAFQVVDDVLDAEAPTATLGKTAGKDAERDKPTYVSTLGLSDAKSFAQELRQDALKALDSFGERALRLREIADFIVMRKF